MSILAILFTLTLTLTLTPPMMMMKGNRHFDDSLVKGKIAYDIPDTMEISKSYKAIATISKSQNDSILFQNIDSTGFEIESIKVSSRVKMFLIDPTGNQNFQITSLNTDEQLVDDSTNTIWKWNIIPLRSGENELFLRTTVKILDDLGENYKDISVFEKHIIVNASIVVVTKQFIGDYWQWLSTVIFIPLIIWGYKKFLFRKKDNDMLNQIGFKENDTNKIK